MTDIEQLQKENDELRVLLKERENECVNAKDYMVKLSETVNGLSAYMERTKDLLKAVGHVGVDIGFGVYELGRTEVEQARELSHETPSQSINHIKAQVEEETIESVELYVGFTLKCIPRKYKEQ